MATPLALPKAGLSPKKGFPPTAITISATARTNSGLVVHSLVGREPVSRLGLSKTRFPGFTKAAMPPKGSSSVSKDSFKASCS